MRSKRLKRAAHLLAAEVQQPGVALSTWILESDTPGSHLPPSPRPFSSRWCERNAILGAKTLGRCLAPRNARYCYYDDDDGMVCLLQQGQRQVLSWPTKKPIVYFMHRYWIGTMKVTKALAFLWDMSEWHWLSEKTQAWGSTRFPFEVWLCHPFLLLWHGASCEGL